jgi:hypothetical protein
VIRLIARSRPHGGVNVRRIERIDINGPALGRNRYGPAIEIEQDKLRARRRDGLAAKNLHVPFVRTGVLILRDA